ncbi:MAG: hypothetical protein ND807_16375 [Vicinamibacterales bacterium]|nr:hypothetical protein [Vicinamibacterales bacterium]
MERKRQREIVIGGLALTIAAIAAYRISTFSMTPAATAISPTSPLRQRTESQVSRVPAIDLDALKNTRTEPADSPRNPFRFKPKPPPPAPAGQGRRTAPPVETGPTEPAPPPRITLKFIGIMESSKTGLVAILSDGRGIPFHGKQGEIIDGRYRILRIGVESLDLAYLDGRGRQTIRFTGQ